MFVNLLNPLETPSHYNVFTASGAVERIWGQTVHTIGNEETHRTKFAFNWTQMKKTNKQTNKNVKEYQHFITI